jgi:uncharacterized membrane protein
MVTNTSGRRTAVNSHTVAAVFNSEDQAIAGLNQLKDAGFNAEHVSVVARDRRTVETVNEGADTGSAATGGAVSGGVLGGLAGFLVGISALVIPGIGPIVGTGILVSTLAGAGIGAAAGGLVGALADQGVPEADARAYETHVSEGRILVTVGATSMEQARQAEQILHGAGGADVRSYARPA